MMDMLAAIEVVLELRCSRRAVHFVTRHRFESQLMKRLQMSCGIFKGRRPIASEAIPVSRS